MSRTLFYGLILLIALSIGAASVPEQVPLSGTEPHATYAWSWEDCGEQTDIVQINSLTLSPDPPKPGQNLTVHATGYVGEIIDDGAYAEVTLKLGLIKILQKDFDICKEASNANVSLQCPVQTGDQDVKHTVSLPVAIPPAKFKVEVRAFNKNDSPLLCVNIQIDFLPTIKSGLFR